MPMPMPKKMEKEDEFMTRCMGDDMMKEEYPDQEQRTAVCETQWRKGEKVEDNLRGFSIKATAVEAEIYLYEEIGAGLFGGVSAKKFTDEIKKMGKVNNITVRINSIGGDVFDGLAIYNILKQHSAKVVIYVDGVAASIASIIAMAGDEIHMAENALMMIHDPWTIAMGNAADMREVADRLEKVTGQLVGTYTKKTGKDSKEIAAMMADETWMTAAEAIDMGFVDFMAEEMKMAAHFDISKFKFKKNPLAGAVAAAKDIPPAPPAGGKPMLPDLSCFDRGIERCKRILK